MKKLFKLAFTAILAAQLSMLFSACNGQDNGSGGGGGGSGGGESSSPAPGAPANLNPGASEDLAGSWEVLSDKGAVRLETHYVDMVGGKVATASLTDIGADPSKPDTFTKIPTGVPLQWAIQHNHQINELGLEISGLNANRKDVAPFNLQLQGSGRPFLGVWESPDSDQISQGCKLRPIIVYQIAFPGGGSTFTGTQLVRMNLTDIAFNGCLDYLKNAQDIIDHGGAAPDGLHKAMLAAGLYQSKLHLGLRAIDLQINIYANRTH
jgi:hypothetical protein